MCKSQKPKLPKDVSAEDACQGLMMAISFLENNTRSAGNSIEILWSIWNHIWQAVSQGITRRTMTITDDAGRPADGVCSTAAGGMILGGVYSTAAGGTILGDDGRAEAATIKQESFDETGIGVSIKEEPTIDTAVIETMKLPGTGHELSSSDKHQSNIYTKKGYCRRANVMQVDDADEGTSNTSGTFSSVVKKPCYRINNCRMFPDNDDDDGINDDQSTNQESNDIQPEVSMDVVPETVHDHQSITNHLETTTIYANGPGTRTIPRIHHSRLRKIKQKLEFQFKIHKCRICDEHFETPEALAAHFILHDIEKAYECMVCLKIFQNRSNLRKHMMNHGDDFHMCTCGRGFANFIDLRFHELEHQGKNPVACLVCSMLFVNEADLDQHASKHTKK
jgi:hypothetical protein